MSDSRDPIDPTRPRSVQSQPVSQDVLRDLEEFLVDGLIVYDLNGERVGGVKAYRASSGYLLVGSGMFGHRDLYIPFRLIRSVNPQNGIVLSEPKDVLLATYTEPPTVYTLVENQPMPEPQQRITPDTLPAAVEVRVVRSGYDDSTLTVVDRIELSSIAERLSVGLAVYDINGVRLGDITQYDTERSLLVVEKVGFKPHVLYVPFSVIARIDRDALSVYLTLPMATLLAEQAKLSAQS